MDTHRILEKSGVYKTNNRQKSWQSCKAIIINGHIMRKKGFSKHLGKLVIYTIARIEQTTYLSRLENTLWVSFHIDTNLQTENPTENVVQFNVRIQNTCFC